MTAISNLPLKVADKMLAHHANNNKTFIPHCLPFFEKKPGDGMNNRYNQGGLYLIDMLRSHEKYLFRGIKNEVKYGYKLFLYSVNINCFVI